MRVLVPRPGWRLTPRQVNLVLELLVAAAVVTGLVSWAVGDRWVRWMTLVHGVIGVALVLLVPAKMRGSVRAGFRRRRGTRWISAGFGVLVLTTIALGVLHATGLWYGVGYWSALWTHALFGFLVVPLLVWHVFTRPVRPRITDLDRRGVLRVGAVAAAAVGVYAAQEAATRVTGLAGGDRRATGSHEVASGDPANMPAVIWLDDRRPEVGHEDDWPLVVGGAPVSIASLRARARPVVAVLDCTGGWWSEQAWDAVPLAELLPHPEGRSVRVTSATGYDRRFDIGSLDRVHLAVGYGGRPLLERHGAPVRLVAPGRRGPWWVKWVTSVEPDDRPSWLQPPLPLT
jgi:DMSO/TMAO reductase YedYZ molybdopterin-dependent catalytic subunit